MSLPANELAQALRDYQGFIRSLASRYSGYGVEMDDLVQEGNLGMLLAAERFEPGRKLKFITYAQYWIRARILSAVERVNGATTSDRRKAFWRGSRAGMALEAAGLSSNADAVAEVLGIEPKEVEYVNRARSYKIRLDQPRAGDDGGKLIRDSLASDTAGPDALLADADQDRYRATKMSAALEKLTPRDRLIIELRYLAEKPWTLTTLAEKLGISRERCRVVSLAAVKKMKKKMAVGV